MRKRYVLAAIGFILAGITALSGCSSAVETQAPGIVEVRTVGADSESKVTVTGRETVKVVPDMASAVFAVTTEDSSAEKCQQLNTEQLERLIAFLNGQGYGEQSIRTSGFSLDPQYDWSGNTRKLVGYSMRTQVEVTDIPMDSVGSILTAGVANGANEIDSVSWYSSEYDTAYEQALEAAVALARKKAETLAAAGGKTVGEVLNIEEYSDSQSGRYVSAELTNGTLAFKEMAADTAEGASGSSMNVMPGEMQISADISVEFALVDAE